MGLGLEGVIPPVVTPLLDRDRLDRRGLERQIDRLIAGGSRGLFLLGTTGEAASLSYRLREELVRAACSQANGKVPVLVGASDTSMVGSLELGRRAAQAGADAVVVAPPYYYRADQAELANYFRELAREMPLPLALYNIPSMTKVELVLETVRALSEVPSIIGVKDSSGNRDYFGGLLALKARRPDWRFLVGEEKLLPEALRMGGHGVVAGGANLLPRLLVECFEAAESASASRAKRLEAEIKNLRRLYSIGSGSCGSIKAIKCALSLLGICDDFMAPPLSRLSAPERNAVREFLREAQASPTQAQSL